MCSRKCDMPASVADSWRAPTRTHTPIESERTESTCSPTTVRPDGSWARRNRSCSANESSSIPERRPEASAGTCSIQASWTPLPPRVLGPPPGPIATPAAAARPAAARGGRLPRVHVARKRLLPAQLDLPFPVDPDHLDQDRVSLVDHVLDALDPMGLELRDVNEAVLARGNLDEGSERHDPPHGAGVDAPHLGIFGDPPDDLACAVAVRAAEGRDPDLARILDVDLRAGLGADLLDHLAAGSDHLTNLVGIDHHDVDPGRVRRELG